MKKVLITMLVGIITIGGFVGCGTEAKNQTVLDSNITYEENADKKPITYEEKNKIKADFEDKLGTDFESLFTMDAAVSTDEFGDDSFEGIVTNNSGYDVVWISIKYEYNDPNGEKDIAYFVCSDTLLNGESSTKETILYGSGTDFVPVELSAKFVDGDGEHLIDYDFKLGKITLHTYMES